MSERETEHNRGKGKAQSEKKNRSFSLSLLKGFVFKDRQWAVGLYKHLETQEAVNIIDCQPEGLVMQHPVYPNFDQPIQ